MHILVSARGHRLLRILFGLAVGGAGVTAGAQSTRYVDAYNVLADNLNARLDLGFTAPAVARKNAAQGDTVTQADLDVLRSRVGYLMGHGFLTGPGPSQPAERDAANAFGLGVRYRDGVLLHPSLMDSIGDGQGNWTRVPDEFTVSGKAVYAATFLDVPPLWIHFQELDRAIRSLQCSGLPYGAPAHWTANGEANARNGWGGYSTGGWPGQVSDANHAFDGAATTSPDDKAPYAWTRGYGTRDYMADITRLFAYYEVRQLTTSRPHRLFFHAYAENPSTVYLWNATSVFEANGDPLEQNRWTQWSQSERSSSASERSAVLGSPNRPAWCPMPGQDCFQLLGYQVSDVMVTVQWQFTDASLVRPANDDVEDDGLADTGCGCKDCTTQAGVAWRGGGAGAHAHLPLGLSGSAAPGGLRVKAYLTQYRDHGVLGDVYSLNTRATGARANDGDWDFVAVKRPEGAEVVFSVYGRDPGRPVDGGYRYRLTRSTTGDYTLHFPVGDGEITHTYRGYWLVAVGRKSAGNEETVEWGGVPGSWPKLITGYAGDVYGGQVTSVDSPLYNAVPVYAGGVAQSVEYHYHSDGHVDTCQWYKGSDGYRTTDAWGRMLDDVRIVADDANGLTEIWHGISTNGATQVARMERRERWGDASSGLTLTRDSVIAEVDEGAAETNATVTAEAEYPWGFASVSRTVAEGTPEEQTERWTYYTNTDDGVNYGHLRLAEQPGGAWQGFVYDSLGRVILERDGFRDGPSEDTNECREIESVYAGDPRLEPLGASGETPAERDDRPRLTIERLQGHETARTYFAFALGLQTVKRCVVPGARYDDLANLVTVTYLTTDSAFTERVSRIERPDGTRSVYTYAAWGDGARVTEESGSGPAGGGVTNGTRRETFTDANQRVVSETRTDIASGLLLAATDYTLDGYGRVLVASNRVDGSATRTEYGCCGPELSVDTEGLATRYAYDALKRPVAVERAATTSYTTYNGADATLETRLTAAGLPDQVSRTAYDQAGRAVLRVDERGGETRYAYATNNAGGRVVTTVYPDGGFAVENYFRDGQLRCVTGTAVQAVCYDYGADEQGHYTVEYRGADTNAAEWVRTCTDLLGRVWRVEYPDGYASESTYDVAGRLVRESDGITVRLTEYDDLGSPMRQGVDMDGNGRLDPAGMDRIQETVTTCELFAGRPAQRTVQRVFAEAGSDARTTVSEYWRALDGATTWNVAFGRTARVDVVRSPESATRLETATDPAGVSMTTSYTNGLPVRVERRDATGGVVSVATSLYDAFGRVVLAGDTGPDGSARTIAYGFDAGGLVTNEVRVAGDLRRETRYEYDAMGRLVRTVLPDGSTLEQAYGPAGELLAQWGTSANPRQYGYDAQGRLSELRTFRAGTNGPADVTTWRYDVARGWLAAKGYADGTTNAFEYSPNGELVRRVSARGVATDYAYDPAGALTNVAYSDGSPGTALEVDRQGRIAAVRDGLGTSSNRFADDGSLVAATFPHVEVEADYGYDAVGRRARLMLRTPDGVVATGVSYAFDPAGRVQSVAAGPTGTYAYAADGRAVAALSVDAGAGEIVGGCRQYDAAGRVTGLAWRTNGAVWKSVAQEYDASDRLVRRTRENGTAWTYGYDATGQLTSALPDAGVALTYAYDGCGNRTTAGRPDGPRTDYQANALNQYIGLDALEFGANGFRGTIFSFGGAAGPTLQTNGSGGLIPRHTDLSYDADGNLTNDGTRAYAWDAENRLVSVEPLAVAPGVQRVRLGYDYRSRRVWRTVEVWDGGGWVGVETNRFVYDGWHAVAEVGDRATGSYTNTYVWGLDLSGTFEGAGGIGGLLFGQFGACGAAATVTYAYDGNGNVIGLADAATGEAVAEYAYGPFGELFQAIETPEVRRSLGGGGWRFSTRYADAVTGLALYPLRPYSSVLGRFITRDPIEEQGGLNLYSFVYNEPINDIDPLGLALYAIDGTWADAEAPNAPDTNVHRFYLRSREKPSYYYRGSGAGERLPRHVVNGATGWDSGSIRDEVYGQICSDVCNAQTSGTVFKVNLVGWSRGATICLGLAQKLNNPGCKCTCGEKKALFGLGSRTEYAIYKPVPVNWIGLFDAVDMTPNPADALPGVGWPDAITPNVGRLDHARKTGWQPFFPTTKVKGQNVQEFNRYDGTHTSHNDIGAQLNNGALDWMIKSAQAAGVKVQ